MALAACSRCLRNVSLRRTLRRMYSHELSVQVRLRAARIAARRPNALRSAQAQIDGAYEIAEACSNPRDGYLHACFLASHGAVARLMVVVKHHVDDAAAMRAVVRALSALCKSGAPTLQPARGQPCRALA